MQKKLNEDFIDSYCEKFASRVTADFFDEGKEVITGKEILKITPSQQTNFFIIKLLFRYWQEEASKLESPFFNYQNEEVKQALVDFMNVLSQHIEIKKEKFQLLLNHAIKDNLYLVASPEVYLQIDLESRGVEVINEKVIAGTLKYIKMYRKQISNFLSDMKGLTIDDIVDEAMAEFEELDVTEELENEVAILSDVLPVKSYQILVDAEDEQDEFDDFDDDDDDILERGEEDLIDSGKNGAKSKKEEKEEKEKEEKVKKPKEEAPEELEEPKEEPEAEPEAQQEAEEEKPEENKEEDVDVEEQKETIEKEEEKEEVVPAEDKETATESEEAKEEKPEEEESENAEEEVKTVNERFSEKTTTVADRLEKSGQSSMMELISVNHQYMFVKELFNDNEVTFQEALFQIEEHDSFDGAIEFLVQSYAREYGWDMQSNEVKELLKIIFRKFRN